MKIYKENLKEFAEEMLDKKKKDPEIIIELDKQLKYIEKSIAELRQTSTKHANKSKENIKKRTTDNLDLINQLTKLRDLADQINKESLDLDKTINEKNLQKTRLEHEIESLQTQIRQTRNTKVAQQTESSEVLF